MKKAVFASLLILTSGFLFAQKKTTSSATVTFDATTPKDAYPKAENKTVIGSVNTSTGAVAFEAMVSNFAFTNPMIQEHFNDKKWMNSAEWPKFTFKGKITNLSEVNFSKDGTYTAQVSGKLTIKDKSKDVKTPVKVVVNNGKISTSSSFTISLADYDIEGAPIDAGKVAKEPKITVVADF